MLDKVQPILVAVLGVLGTFKSAIIEARSQEAEGFIGEKVSVRMYDGECIDGVLKNIATQLGGEVVLCMEVENPSTAAIESNLIDVPIFLVTSICAYQERVKIDNTMFGMHPLTGKKVEITTHITRYTGVLKEACHGSATIFTSEGTIYLSGEYAVKAL